MTTEVEIFGAIYPVRGEDDSEYLQELASLVDQKMRDIAQQASTVDTSKIAILAALNLADELLRCREGQEGDQDQVRARVEELTGTLDVALES